MKNNSGISLITLAVMIVVMLILASIVMNSGIESIDEANDTKVAVEIEKLKEAVSKRMTDNARNEAAYPFVGKKVDDIVGYAYYIEDMSNGDLQKFIATVDEESVDYMRLVDNIDAAKLGVSSVAEDHYFIVDYYNGKVYGTVNMTAYENSAGAASEPYVLPGS